MRRARLTSFVFYISLAALILVLAAWVRSHWRYDWIVLFGHDERQTIYDLGYDNGRCYFMLEHAIFGALHTSSGSDTAGSSWSYRDVDLSGEPFEFAGFEASCGGGVMIFIPFSAIAIVLMIAAALSFRRLRSISTGGFEVEVNTSSTDIGSRPADQSMVVVCEARELSGAGVEQRAHYRAQASSSNVYLF